MKVRAVFATDTEFCFCEAQKRRYNGAVFDISSEKLFSKTYMEWVEKPKKKKAKSESVPAVPQFEENFQQENPFAEPIKG